MKTLSALRLDREDVIALFNWIIEGDLAGNVIANLDWSMDDYRMAIKNWQKIDEPAEGLFDLTFRNDAVLVEFRLRFPNVVCEEA